MIKSLPQIHVISFNLKSRIAGAVYVLFMNKNGTVLKTQKISNTTGNLNVVLNEGDEFGSSVASIGDLNEDGTQDVIVGAQGDNGATGVVYVLLFVNASQVSTIQETTTQEITTQKKQQHKKFLVSQISMV